MGDLAEAPLCRACGLEPVQKVEGRTDRVYRVVDGVRWRDYCSRRCAMAVANIRLKKEGRLDGRALVAFNRQRFTVRLKARLADVIGQLRQETGLPLARCERLLWEAERRGYQRGYNTAWARQRHTA